MERGRGKGMKGKRGEGGKEGGKGKGGYSKMSATLSMKMSFSLTCKAVPLVLLHTCQ